MNEQMIEQAKAEIRAKAYRRAYAAGKKGHLNLSELWAYYDAEMERNEEELRAREMVISCVCYGTEYNFFDERQGKWGEYGFRYASKLGELRAREIFRDQRDYMRKHATIHCGVHTDYEGCSYNSISWN